jgi:hypothetical protein
MIDATTGLRAFRLLVLIPVFPFVCGLVATDETHLLIVTCILRFNKHSLQSVELQDTVIFEGARHLSLEYDISNPVVKHAR